MKCAAATGDADVNTGPVVNQFNCNINIFDVKRIFVCGTVV